jgi:hypothetical protein
MEIVFMRPFVFVSFVVNLVLFLLQLNEIQPQRAQSSQRTHKGTFKSAGRYSGRDFRTIYKISAGELIHLLLIVRAHS